jgi:hypothetical protein
VIDTQPWYEKVYYPEVNHTVHHPEVNHTEKQISTWQIVTPATPATGVLAQWNWELWDWESGHVHARHETTPSQIDFYYGTSSMHIAGNRHDTAFMVTPGTPAVWGWVITTPWEPGTCGMDRTIQMTKCEERLVVDERAYDELIVDKEAWTDLIYHDGTSHEEIVVDAPAYCKWVKVSDGYWTEWTDWSTEQPFSGKGREIESRWVEKVNNCCCNCNEEKPQIS